MSTRTLAAAALAALSFAAPAMAQQGPKKEFVENYNAAKAALAGRQFAQAIQKADAAAS